MHSFRGGIYKRFIKRPLDILLSLAALILLSPVFLITSLMVKVMLGSPIIFKQKRPGLNERIFMMYKFRTMTNARDEKGILLPDSVRLTKFGKILRSTSIDELPELLNILKGDMSIVGPRPQLVRDMVFMSQEQRTRHSVLPGLTGLAQINGRNDISWETKLSFDLEYIKNISFHGDCRIIYQTLKRVVIREGINTSGMDTAEDLGDYLLKINKITYSDYISLLEKSKMLS